MSTERHLPSPGAVGKERHLPSPGAVGKERHLLLLCPGRSGGCLCRQKGQAREVALAEPQVRSGQPSPQDEQPSGLGHRSHRAQATQSRSRPRSRLQPPVPRQIDVREVTEHREAIRRRQHAPAVIVAPGLNGSDDRLMLVTHEPNLGQVLRTAPPVIGDHAEQAPRH